RRREHVALLGDDRPQDHLGVVHQAFASSTVLAEPAARAVRASSAGWEIKSEAAPSRSATPTFSCFSTATPARLRNDSAALASSAASTTSVEPGRFQSSSRSNACLVFGALNAEESSTASEPRSACSDSALRSAARCSLRLTLKVYERGCGPDTTPPPVQIGERLEPARARPVPFWRQGLAPPPETMPRVFVAAVPRRRAACSARTLWWTSGPLKRAVNARSSSATPFAEDAPEPRIGASGIAAHLHEGTGRAGHRAADEDQVLRGVDLDDPQSALRGAAVSHLPWSADALHDACRRRGGSDRAQRANVVRAV